MKHKERKIAHQILKAVQWRDQKADEFQVYQFQVTNVPSITKNDRNAIKTNKNQPKPTKTTNNT